MFGNHNTRIIYEPEDFPEDWSVSEILLYSFIELHNTPSSCCEANVSHMAKFLRCSERTVQKILKKFQEMGLIVIVSRPGQTNQIQIVRAESDSQTNPSKKQAQPTKVKKEFIPPTYEEWASYCESRDIRQDVAKKSFDYYSSRRWQKANGQKVDNWKGTIIAVWDKPENKYKTGTTTFDGTEIPW